MALPAWLAVITIFPQPVMVSMLPFKEPGPLVTVNVTGLPEAPPVTYELRSNAGSPKVILVGGLKVIVWADFTLITGDMVVAVDRLFIVQVVAVTESQPAPHEIEAIISAGPAVSTTLLDVKRSAEQVPDVAKPFH